MVLAEIRSGAPVDPIAAFASRIQGEVIRPTDEKYDSARRVWNLLADKFPGVVVRPAGAADVIRTVNFARDNNLELAVRSGGHGLAGHGTENGAVVIDLTSMKDITVDPARKMAWVQTGVLAGELTDKTQEYGYAVPTGDASTVGIGGLTLGGGVGWLARKYGLTIDSLVSIEVVTADGQFLTASEDENPDLFWAMRGGHGNFGVATRFQFRLSEVGPIYGGAVILPADAEIIEKALDYANNAPEELTTISFLMHAPPAPFIPEEMLGQLVFIMGVCYTGDPAEGAKVVQPLKDLGALVDFTMEMPYAGMYALAEEGTHPHRSRVRMGWMDRISRETIQTSLEYMDKAPSPASFVQFRVVGGQVNRVNPASTAYSHRDKNFWYCIIDVWNDAAADAAEDAWLTSFWDEVKHEADGVYVNFLADDTKERVADAYEAEKYLRLAAVKAKYDPTNFFHLNHNIKPR